MKEGLKSGLEELFLEKSTEVLRAVAHPIRLTIIDLLSATDSMTVTDIHKTINIEQAIASHHLRILKDKRIVIANRVGKNTFYALRTKSFRSLIDTLKEVIQ